jgi:hypothetical protein
MKRLILCVAGVLSVLTLSSNSRAESYIPPSYFRTLFNSNVRWSHERALYRTQVDMQRLRQLQFERAQRGLPPTRAMLEQARRLDLRAMHHHQMTRSLDAMIHQGRLDSQRHYWGLMLRGW